MIWGKGIWGFSERQTLSLYYYGLSTYMQLALIFTIYGHTIKQQYKLNNMY